MTEPDLPAELVARLSEVRSVGVVTGAGISQESGISTYRGKGGLYDDPEEGDRTIEALSAPTLFANPDVTWRVVADLARQAVQAQPNPAHLAIVEIEDAVSRFVLLTQNVDGLHRAAGTRNMIEIHGNVFETVCMQCQETGTLEADTLVGLVSAPTCVSCGGTLRPDVVLFGEMLCPTKVGQIQQQFHLAVPDLVLAVGTSAMFPYILEPLLVARHEGRLTIEINPESTPLSGVVDFWLDGPAGSYLPLLANAIKSSQSL